MTSGKTIALTRRTFVGKVMSLLFNMLSRLFITFLPRSKHLLISWHAIMASSSYEDTNPIIRTPLQDLILNLITSQRLASKYYHTWVRGQPIIVWLVDTQGWIWLPSSRSSRCDVPCITVVHRDVHGASTKCMLMFCAVLSSFQSCLSLCDPMDCSPLGSSVYEIPQARTLEWVAMPSSRGSFQPRDWTQVSYISCVGRQVLHH